MRRHRVGTRSRKRNTVSVFSFLPRASCGAHKRFGLGAAGCAAPFSSKIVVIVRWLIDNCAIPKGYVLTSTGSTMRIDYRRRGFAVPPFPFKFDDPSLLHWHKTQASQARRVKALS